MLPAVGGIFAGAATAIVTAATDPTAFDTLNLIPTVTPAVVVGLLVGGVLRTRGEVQRLEAQLRGQAEENQQLRKVLVDDAVPALTRTADTLGEIKPILAQVVDMLRDKR